MKAPSQLIEVARRLAPLGKPVAFVGGMVRSLLITDPGAGSARPTDDVDLIVDVGSTVSAYHELGQQLRPCGFRECTDEGAPLCRWVVGEIRVDVMPIDPGILGFSNVWYVGAIPRAIHIEQGGIELAIVDAATFVATKLEAFASRGEGDFMHHDLEDVVAVVEGRLELLSELRAAPRILREFVAGQVRSFLDDPAFLDRLPGHLDGDDASQARLPILLARLRAIAALLDVAEPANDADPTEGVEAEARPPRRWARGRRSPTDGKAAEGSAGSTRVASSNLRTVAYDPVTLVLTIEFQNDRVYAYAGVPSTIHAGLVSAWSKGRYFHQWIRDRYDFERIR